MIKEKYEPSVMESAIITWGEPTRADKFIVAIITIVGVGVILACLVFALVGMISG